MTKFFSKWFRKVHRWLAVPTAILIPVTVIVKLTGSNFLAKLPAQLGQLQSILMLTLAITGAYLYLLPYIIKWQRKQRKRVRVVMAKNESS